jgi:hypothetical protein
MKRKFVLCLPVLCFIITSCSKDPLDHLTEDESRIYITNYDTTANFHSYHTFSITDSVAVVSDNDFRGRQLNNTDAQFVAAVTEALQARGYVKVDRTENPDFGVALSRVTNTQSNLVNYNDYGGYYDSYWDPYYWDYPGYDYYFPSYYGVYETKETALMIDAFDLKNSTNSQIRSLWSGLIRGSGIFNSASPSSQVNALFSQSPYFRYE